MSAAVQVDEVDGVRVRHLDSDDEVTSASLVFGVGSRDELLHEQGVLHALEHVVMREVRDTPLDVNAHVGTSHTQFDVTGRPDRVAEHLARLCRTLADPPVRWLAAEAPVIAAELEGEGGEHQALRAHRYGLRDLGSGAVPGPGPDGLTQDQLRVAAARWFVAANACLLLDGPRPAGLRLPLGDGPRPEHDRVRPRLVGHAAAVLLDGPACAASLLLPPPDPAHLDDLTAELVELRLLESVRHREGLAYVVEALVDDDVAHVSGGRGQDLLVHAEPREPEEGRAPTVFATELLGLLRDGPTEAELRHAAARVAEGGLGRAQVLEQTRRDALDELLGVERAPLAPERVLGVTVADARAYLRGLEPTVLLALPEDVGLDLAALGLEETEVAPQTGTALPEGRRFRPPLLARAFSSSARAAELCLAPDGLHVRLEGRVQSVAWAEVAGVMVQDEHLAVVFGADASAIEIGADLWRDGDVLVDEARRRVPPHLVYNASALLEGPDD